MSRPRPAFGLAVAAAFAGGVVFASALDWTRAAGAQSGVAFAQGGGRVDVSAGFARMAEQVTPAVVSIQTERDPRGGRAAGLPPGHPGGGGGRVPPGFEDFFRQFQPQQQEPVQADGSGFLVSRDGYILTNNHVVGDADRVTVTLTDHRIFKARVVGGDPTTDVAVIKIEGQNLPTTVLGEDSTAKVGDWVVAVGNPLGLDFTVTAGIVSAKGRSGRDLPGLLGGTYSISDFLQTDAAINPGNSGGPLLNARGEVIGINSAIASRTGFYSGYGFAIPISLARSVMDDLVKHGRIRAPVLGVSIDEVTPEDATVAGVGRIEGVFVRGFSPAENSPAERAGLEPGDVIVSADGRLVDRVSTLQRVVRAHEPGETVTVEAMRFGKRQTFRVRLGERPENAEVARANAGRATPAAPVAPAAGRMERLGITVEPVTAEFAREQALGAEDRGVRVTEVARTGPARGALLSPGTDVITEVLYPDRRRIRTPAELRQALAAVKPGAVISLRVFSTAEPIGSRVVNVRVAE